MATSVQYKPVDDAAPIYQRPVPTFINSSDSDALTSSYLQPDPALCLTPDKTILGSPDKGDASGLTPKQVRFDVPPSESSASQISSEISIVDIAADNDLTLGSLDDTLALTDTSELDATVDNNKENLPAPCVAFHADSDLDITVDDQQSTGKIRQTAKNHIVASKSIAVSQKKSLPLKTVPIVSNVKDKIETTARKADECWHKKFGGKKQSVKLDEDVLHRDPPSYIVDSENILKKPEFQTTLKVSQEIRHLKTRELDVQGRVEEKLKKMTIKCEIEEKGAMKVNKPDSFVHLGSLELPAEELIKRRERDKTKKAEAAVKHISTIKQKEQKFKEPDVMEFFRADLQSETASFVLEGLPSFQPALQMSSVNTSFKLYKHLRCWDRLK